MLPQPKYTRGRAILFQVIQSYMHYPLSFNTSSVILHTIDIYRFKDQAPQIEQVMPEPSQQELQPQLIEHKTLKELNTRNPFTYPVMILPSQIFKLTYIVHHARH